MESGGIIIGMIHICDTPAYCLKKSVLESIHCKSVLNFACALGSRYFVVLLHVGLPGLC